MRKLRVDKNVLPAWLMRVSEFSTIHVVLPSSLSKTVLFGSHSGCPTLAPPRRHFATQDSFLA